MPANHRMMIDTLDHDEQDFNPLGLEITFQAQCLDCPLEAPERATYDQAELDVRRHTGHRL